MCEIINLVKEKGNICMNYQLETKPRFKVIGYLERFQTTNNQENFGEISRMWEMLKPNQMTTLFSYSDSAIGGLLGVSDENEHENFNYLIGTSSQIEEIENLTVIDFPEADWLLFSCEGSIPNAMMHLKGKVLKEYLPTSIFEQLKLPRIEVYPQGDMTSDVYHSELWIPVKKRE